MIAIIGTYKYFKKHSNICVTSMKISHISKPVAKINVHNMKEASFDDQLTIRAYQKKG